MKIYIKFMSYINKVLEALGIVATLGMTLFMILTVLNRFLLNGMIVGCEEWSRICFCWILFFMMGCCVNVGNLASIGLVRSVVPKKGQIVHYVLCQIFGLALAYVLVKYGIQYCINCAGQYYGTLRVHSVAVMYSAIPFGGICLGLNCINNVFRAIVMARGGEIVSELSDETDLSLDINVEEVEALKHEAEEKGMGEQ